PPVGQRLLQVGQLAGALLGDDRAAVDDGRAGRVVPPVLQPAQAVEDDAQRRPCPGVPHDSAHGWQRSRVSRRDNARIWLKQTVNVIEQSVVSGRSGTNRPPMVVGLVTMSTG